jgi:hypothetical protein
MEFCGGLWLPRRKILRPERYLNPGVVAGGGVSGGGSVLFDTAAVSGPTAHNITSQTLVNGIDFTMDLASGSNGTTNRALVIAVMFVQHAGGTSTSVSCSWHGQAMSQLATATNGGDIFLFGLRNPDTGANNVALSWTGSNQALIGLLSVVGANQTSDALAFPTDHRTTATGTNSPNSIAITCDSTSIAFAGHIVNANYLTSGGGIDIRHSNRGDLSSGAANYAASANPTLTYSFAGGNTWSSVGCEISA